MFTIGQVAKKYGLSRSTLIYYDNIGILTPSGRSESNYRLYSDNDLNSSLELRLSSINNEIQGLRNQQKVILNILENESSVKGSRVITKETWVSLLKAAGLDEDGMKNWHVEFEKTSPEAHQDFLESIGIEKDEIISIREWSKINSS
jgi:DNA-binding transcriptional MerR regulator